MILFAAIRPPDGLIREVIRFQKGVAGARWSDAQKLHITVGYFGDVDEDRGEELDRALEQAFQAVDQGGFEIRLGPAGHFGHNEPHALYLSVEDHPQLTALHKACRRAARECRITMEARRFIPHLTLAYLKPEPRLDRIINFEKRLSGYRSRPIMVDQIRLYSSWRRKTGGNLYREEATYPLLGQSMIS